MSINFLRDFIQGAAKRKQSMFSMSKQGPDFQVAKKRVDLHFKVPYKYFTKALKLKTKVFWNSSQACVLHHKA